MNSDWLEHAKLLINFIKKTEKRMGRKKGDRKGLDSAWTITWGITAFLT